MGYPRFVHHMIADEQRRKRRKTMLPENTVIPVVTGSYFVDAVLTATTGTWAAVKYPVQSYRYQWFADGLLISGANSSTFTLTEAQVGTVVTVGVKAKNAIGVSDTALSDDTVDVVSNLLGAGSLEGDIADSMQDETDVLVINGKTRRALVRHPAVPANSKHVDMSGATNFITYTSPSIKSITHADGLQKFAAHNLFLSSDAPATQNITVISGAFYKVKITGSGQIVLSGAGSGTVTDGSPVTITAATTTLTCTVSGGPSTAMVFRNPAEEKYLATGASAARYALPITHDASSYDTSTTSITLGAGSHTITKVISGGYSVGDEIRLSAQADVDGQFMVGKVTAASGTSVTFNVPSADYVTGSGTVASWYIIKILGWLYEPAATNVVLYNSDLTNAAWTKSNITAAKDQTGPGGVANSASSIEATAGNGTCLQAITLGSSARFQTTWVKRLVGTGTIQMTMDNGSTWTAITVTSSWAKVSIPTQTLANPTVGFRIVTSGDKIAVARVQNEATTVATSSIETFGASVTRAADDLKLLTSAFPWSDSAGYIRIKGLFSYADTGSTDTFFGAHEDSDSFWRFRLGTSSTHTGSPDWALRDDASSKSLGITNTYSPGTNVAFNMASTFNSSEWQAAANGTATSTDTSPTTLPSPSEFLFGRRSGVPFIFPLIISEFVYIPLKKTQANLEAETA